MAKNDDKGVWLDTESGQVVNKQPARGRQIVAPGKEITPNLQRVIELYQANADSRRVEQATAPAVEETRTEPASKDTTTDKAPAKSTKRKS